MKKFIPKDAKPPTIRPPPSVRKVRRKEIKLSQNKCISLKKEFDLVMNTRYSSISERERYRIWHTIGTQLTNELITTSSLIRLISILINHLIDKNWRYNGSVATAVKG